MDVWGGEAAVQSRALLATGALRVAILADGDVDERDCELDTRELGALIVVFDGSPRRLPAPGRLGLTRSSAHEPLGHILLGLEVLLVDAAGDRVDLLKERVEVRLLARGRLLVDDAKVV